MEGKGDREGEREQSGTQEASHERQKVRQCNEIKYERIWQNGDTHDDDRKELDRRGEKRGEREERRKGREEAALPSSIDFFR